MGRSGGPARSPRTIGAPISRQSAKSRCRRLAPLYLKMSARGVKADVVIASVSLDDKLRRHSKFAVFFDLKGLSMKCSKRSFSVVSVLFAVLLSSSTETLNARDTDLAPLVFATAQTAKQQCINTCRARYRDCLSLKQIPSSECRGIYQDCTRNTCHAGPAGRSSWPGFPS